MEFLSEELIRQVRKKAIELDNTSIMIFCAIYLSDMHEYQNKTDKDPNKQQEVFWLKLEKRLNETKKHIEDFLENH